MTPSTPSTMTRTITIRANCTSEHSSTPLVVLPLFLMMCHDPLGSSSLSLSSSRHVAHVSLSLILFDLPFYFNLSFPVFLLSSVLMYPDLHTDLNNPDSVENNLRHSAKGSLDAYDVTFSLTGYEPNDTVSNDTVSNELGNSQGSFSYITQSSDLDIDDATLGKLLGEAHREHADYRNPEGVSVSQSSLSVVFDRTVKPVGKSTGTAEERNSSSAQIRTLFDEQRQTIIAECYEKISHHEFQAARAEQERQILQEELCRQQKDFREVHQQSLTEMEELRKF